MHNFMTSKFQPPTNHVFKTIWSIKCPATEHDGRYLLYNWSRTFHII